MDISAFQRRIADLYLEKDRRRGVEPTFLWLVEEVGELSEAVRRKEMENVKEEMADSDASAAASASSPQVPLSPIEEELADVLAWLVSVANLLDVDLEKAALAKYPERCRRCGARPCGCPESPARAL